MKKKPAATASLRADGAPRHPGPALQMHRIAPRDMRGAVAARYGVGSAGRLARELSPVDIWADQTRPRGRANTPPQIRHCLACCAAQAVSQMGQNPPPSPALGCLLSPGADMVRERSVEFPHPRNVGD